MQSTSLSPWKESVISTLMLLTDFLATASKAFFATWKTSLTSLNSLGVPAAC